MVTVALKLKDALLLGRKAMTNLDSILKNRDIKTFCTTKETINSEKTALRMGENNSK